MKSRPASRPTLKDIALQTGYSVNTVSRALRNMADISLETREKIHAVARSVGYHNNALAQSLRLGRTKTIAVIIPDISNLFYAFALVEIERGARERGYATILLNTSESGEFEREAVKTALQKNVDGIIFGPAQHTLDNTRILAQSGTPYVQFARRFNKIDSDFVVADDQLGGFQATAHLLENGHRSIAFLNALALHNSSARGRQAGYCAAHEAAGLKVQEDLIRTVNVLGTDSGEVLSALLERRPDITAVFAFSDLVALAAIDHLERHGRRVPEDISIVGFDNIRAHINLPTPLTTVDIHIKVMANTALEHLMDRLEGDGTGPRGCVVPTTLVPGRTVRDMR